MGGGGDGRRGSGRGKRPDERQRVSFSIDLPNVKVDGNVGPEHLPELRKILEALNAPALAAENDEDSPEFPDVAARMTQEFYAHVKPRLENSLLLDEDVTIAKSVLPFREEVDLEAGSRTRTIAPRDVKAAVESLVGEARLERVRECLVHLRGDLSEDEQRAIMDAVRQRLGVATAPRFYSTKQDVEGNALLEAVFISGVSGRRNVVERRD